MIDRQSYLFFAFIYEEDMEYMHDSICNKLMLMDIHLASKCNI